MERKPKKAKKKPSCLEAQIIKSQEDGGIFSNTIETEMVTLERIDTQKRFLLKQCYTKKVQKDQSG